MNKTETDKKLVQIANDFCNEISETLKQKIFLVIIPAQCDYKDKMHEMLKKTRKCILNVSINRRYVS